MAVSPGDRKPHILVHGTARPEPYTYPKTVGGPRLALPPRERPVQSATLLVQLHAAKADLPGLHAARSAVGIKGDRGLCLEFRSDPEFELALRSLDRADRRGDRSIELLAVREDARAMTATVLVPEGKLAEFERLVREYAKEDTKKGKPKNRSLIDSISEIRRAALDSFWTDDPSLWPRDDEPIWWEIWLRLGTDRDALVADFKGQARRLKMRVGEETLRFQERTVLLAHGTAEQLASSVELLDCIAELRRAKEVASFFSEMPPREQRRWADDLRARVQWPADGAPAVCLLDTGVNHGHPLIEPALRPKDLHAYDPDWTVADHNGHGTEMAGLALYGDLTDVLSSSAPSVLEHCLESVKMVPPPAFPSTDPKLYGVVTQESLARAEVTAPHRRRAVSMTVTTTDFRDRGAPSSWSAELDRLIHGSDDDARRLFFLAAGNVERESWANYPSSNDVEQIHDPGQAWNAVTVGACTDKVWLDSAKYRDWTPLAPAGALAPSSTTSVIWKSGWPNKPDIVLEGGNAAVEPGTARPDPVDDLALLTTHWRPEEKLFVPTGDTSASTAQAARMGAILMARYPQYWPETIRALLIHSAEWRPAMIEGAGGNGNLLLRRHGYGVPDLDRACWSASNSLTLIAQDEVQPFVKRGSTVKTQDLNLHALPWPQQQLRDLFDADVELRITLSYFVEPNPARRGWKYRHRYPSHGLRFAVQNPLESLANFRARISKVAQDEESGAPGFSEPGWRLGRLRNRSSVHSDRWHGSATALADRTRIAVFPVGGWWKERPQLDRWQRPVRYALIVSIHTAATNVDIYTPVEAMVGVPIELG